ncbi:hypothetical protein [Paraburkholderia bonniea]|uniref:hypothetical protein n=1 Tax=Paraburkholderia bonniea TaxID=2152891 RepID=UPI0012924819|nr:hypothetical protein [Paraburkholderia bonniea]
MKFSELMKIREKPLEFCRVMLLRMSWFLVFLIVVAAMLFPDAIPDNSVASWLSEMGLMFPRIEEYSRRTSFPFALLVSYGGAFWLGWASGWVIYLTAMVNLEMKARVRRFIPKARWSGIILTIIFAGFIFGRDGENKPIYWLFRLMTESRIYLAAIAGGTFYLNLIMSASFFFAVEYHVRRYIWQR